MEWNQNGACIYKRVGYMVDDLAGTVETVIKLM
jgi:hypothetical protein